MSPTTAFFGATGDCAGYCLAETLKAGYDCRALARTPAKLTSSMEKKGVSADILERHLTIIPGDVKDIEAVKRTLLIKPGTVEVVDKIVSGIGGYPTLQWSIKHPVVAKEQWLCRDAGAMYLRALQELKLPAGKKPLLINISTTGIPPKGMPRDVPVLFVPLYHWLLADAHVDKEVLQENLAAHAQLSEEQRGISGYVNVKASLLMDGPAVGLQAVRQGVDESPAVGYTIRRSDVGQFLAEQLVKSEVRPEWMNRSVTITY